MFEDNNPGYLNPLYAQSLNDFGEPMELKYSGGWILKRPILRTSNFDGMGCYPIFACRNWDGLRQDLKQLSESKRLVSLSLVTDPFGEYTHTDLSRYFKDLAKPYKQHFIVDLSRPKREFVDAHHQHNARKALKLVEIETCDTPEQYLDEWVALYGNLIERHNIKGVARFSRSAFEAQLQVPGIVAFRASRDGVPVGMLLWYIQEEVGYYHLGAYSPEGYKLNASFALFWTLLDYFASMGLKWLSLGAGAGVHGNEEDGLTRFKRGWSTGVRTAYFCGRIFDAEKYERLSQARGILGTTYFPAYRSNEI